MTSDYLPNFAECEGFEWDEGNSDKNWLKHEVSGKEAEEVFLNQPQVIYQDILHSNKETRYGILGITNNSRELSVFFTIRNNKIRIISARDQKRGRERNRYTEARRQYEK